jgi:hypothetical protein
VQPEERARDGDEDAEIRRCGHGGSPVAGSSRKSTRSAQKPSAPRP